MNKSIKITPDIIAYLRCKKIPEVWNPNYSKCYAKIDKEVSENHFIRYMSISEFRIRAEKVDEMKFLKRFQELILDYGLYMIKRELDDCYIVGIPKFKYVINL